MKPILKRRNIYAYRLQSVFVWRCGSVQKLMIEAVFVFVISVISLLLLMREVCS